MCKLRNKQKWTGFYSYTGYNEKVHKWFVQKGNSNSTRLWVHFFHWNSVSQWVLWYYVYTWDCMYMFICPKTCMKINNESKICSIPPSFIPLIKHSSDCKLLGPCFSRKSCLRKITSVYVCVLVLCVVCICVDSLSLCSVSRWGMFKGQCERPAVCRSAGCWGCAGLAGVGGVWGRGRSHQGGGEWSVTAVHGLNPPVAAPQPACLRSQNGLKSTEEAGVNCFHWH